MATRILTLNESYAVRYIRTGSPACLKALKQRCWDDFNIYGEDAVGATSGDNRASQYLEWARKNEPQVGFMFHLLPDTEC